MRLGGTNGSGQDAAELARQRNGSGDHERNCTRVVSGRGHEESPPDLVILDVMMPGMDGFEVCEQLRKNVRPQRLEVDA